MTDTFSLRVIRQSLCLKWSTRAQCKVLLEMSNIQPEQAIYSSHASGIFMVQANNDSSNLWHLTNAIFLGFRALSEAYLDAAKATEEGTKEDTEELYLLAARMVRKRNIRVLIRSNSGIIACIHGRIWWCSWNLGRIWQHVSWSKSNVIDVETVAVSNTTSETATKVDRKSVV